MGRKHLHQNGCILNEDFDLNENAVLISLAVPEFTRRPQDTSEKEFSDGWLHCQADGNPRPRVKWLHGNGKELQVKPNKPKSPAGNSITRQGQTNRNRYVILDAILYCSPKSLFYFYWLQCVAECVCTEYKMISIMFTRWLTIVDTLSSLDPNQVTMRQEV